MEWHFRNDSLPLGTKTYIMGILNITPDSFSDGGLWQSVPRALAHAVEMEEGGADLLDIGAQSTKPGHTPLCAEEEWQRLKPVLTALQGKIHIPISVDTFFPTVAQRSLELGVSIINDVSGTFQEEMAALVARYHAGWVVMHTANGTSDDCIPCDNIIDSVNEFFQSCLESCQPYGIDQNQLCFDMGIGFGKTYEQNLTLLRHHAQLLHPNNALLTGLSRKRVIGKGSKTEEPTQRIWGNIAAHTCAIMGGTDILRVHDVVAEKAGATMADTLLRTSARKEKNYG